jgi:hypothetical protein
MAITLKQALEIIELGEWMSLDVLTANINQGTGGKLLIISKCRLAKSRIGRQVIIGASVSARTNVNSRDPKSNENFTRNIELTDKRIITVHPIHILQINNHLVI